MSVNPKEVLLGALVALEMMEPLTSLANGLIAIDFSPWSGSVECLPALVIDERRPPPVEVSCAETTSALAAMTATCENFMLKDLKGVY